MEYFYLFRIALRLNRFLFTHAGVTKWWADKYKINEPYVERDINHLFQTNPKVFNDVGMVRGGWSKTGSPVWADISEHESFPLFSMNYIQIFGHSQQTKESFICKDGKLICLDCRKLFVLEDEKVNEYKDLAIVP